jgi:hypothetical protein
MSYYPAGWTTRVGHAWVITAEPNAGDQWDVSINPATGNAWVRTGEEDLHIFTGPERYRKLLDKGTGTNSIIGFTYTGYAVHPQPQDASVIPWEERPNRVWLMGKFAHYFHNGDQQVYDMDFYERAHNELSKEFPGFEFVGAIEDSRSEEDKQKWGPVPAVIRNVGRLDREEFEREFGMSKLMLGIGAPSLSPSPFRALAKVSWGRSLIRNECGDRSADCQGVPFANPHNLREGGSNEDDSTWSMVQHESMERVPEPYVYQVQGFNYSSFINSIRKALQTPIGQ